MCKKLPLFSLRFVYCAAPTKDKIHGIGMVILLEESIALSHSVVLCHSNQLNFLMLGEFFEERVLDHNVEHSAGEEQSDGKSGRKVRTVSCWQSIDILVVCVCVCVCVRARACVCVFFCAYVPRCVLHL